MPEEQRITCANPLCGCPVAQAKQYCDPTCETHDGIRDADQADCCKCEHTDKCYRVCDLVMKGGITSGIIYPPLAIALNECRYRFRNVGGTSAGAIAAAVVAAAEHGRAKDGFRKLKNIKDWLSKDSNLRRLFQPSRQTAPLMNTLFGYMEMKWLGKLKLPSVVLTPARVLLTVVAYDWLTFILGSVAGTLIARLFVWSVNGAWPTKAALLTAAIFALAGGVLVAALRMGYILTNVLPSKEQGFGLCTGRGSDPKKIDHKVLTDWLSQRINDLAGLETHAKSAPLTFGDLWGDPFAAPKDRKVDLRMMTSNLSQNQPYLLPFECSLFVFKEADMRRLFPPNVVAHLLEKSKERACHGFELPKGYYLLPTARNLPVVFAARMSLSFPVLISMIPLYTICAKAFANNVRFEIEDAPVGYNADGSTTDPTESVVLYEQRADSATWERVPDERKYVLRDPDDLQLNWFSDGGICSNFPIHFFDAWLPTRPTFGVNLTSQLANLAPDKSDGARADAVKSRSSFVVQRARAAAVTDSAAASYDQDVYLPRPDEIVSPEWIPIDGVGDFASSIFRTAQNYRDNTQAMLPSYRERIVQIRLTDEEGGLNLDMSEGIIKSVVAKGDAAGEKLLRYFDFSHHQWVRFRTLMKQVESSLINMKGVAAEHDIYHGLTVKPEPIKVDDFPYPPDFDGWLANVAARLRTMGAEISTWEGQELFADAQKSPQPEPVLRVTPQI